MISALDQEPELSKYELLERIGSGGMATVYRARDRRLGREVAVKLIHAHLRESVEVGARFASEARAVARLRHPNVVEVYDVSDEGESERYLVVELVRGVTLRAVLNERQSLPPELTACIGLEVAAALEHAHAQGIVHRDVKPENVLVDRSAESSGPGGSAPAVARIKLTDFGIAKLLDAQGVTSTGQVLGSPAHMAPEQIEGGEVGPRADVFALGVMLYECMVGRLPFDGKNPAQVLRRVLEGTYPAAEQESPRVGSRFARILDAALARDPSGRYASIKDFMVALRAELSRVGIEEPRREIERFLSDPEGYSGAVEPGIVKALLESGEAARAAGDVPLASAQFNRALAYRPGDPDLVRRVSGLARRQRLLRAVRYGALAVGALAVAGGVVAWARSRVPALREDTATPAGSAASAGPRSLPASDPSAFQAPEATSASASGSAASRTPVLRAAPVRKPTTRLVKVNVVGPKGGDLEIDGARVEQQRWMSTEPLELAVGAHRFEFVLRDTQCCTVPPAFSRQIEAGEGPMNVVITVSYKDARLVAERAPGGVLQCPTLFAGDLPVPGSRNVSMGDHPTVSGTCVLTPAAGGAPIRKTVTLTAGEANDTSWL